MSGQLPNIACSGAVMCQHSSSPHIVVPMLCSMLVSVLMCWRIHCWYAFSSGTLGSGVSSVPVARCARHDPRLDDGSSCGGPALQAPRALPVLVMVAATLRRCAQSAALVPSTTHSDNAVPALVPARCQMPLSRTAAAHARNPRSHSELHPQPVHVVPCLCVRLCVCVCVCVCFFFISFPPQPFVLD